MEYDPYRDMTNDMVADSPAVNEQTDSQLSTMKNVSMEKIKSLHNIGILDNVPNNTVAEATSNMDVALPWWKNANQPSYKFSRNLLDGYGQNGGMNDRFFVESYCKWKLEEKANESLDEWVIQAVGEKAIGGMLGHVTKAFNLNGIEQTALNAAWNRFVQEAKTGRWESRTR